MRLAIVATPALSPDQRPVPGALDGDVLRARLPLSDTAFDIVDLDPDRDLAEQLETLFEERGPTSTDLVLLYASSNVALSKTGELFICLDPTDPDVGDSLCDITAVFEERFQGPTLFVLELRHAPDKEDPFRSAAVVAAAKEAIRSPSTGIEALIAARQTPTEIEDRASPFTQAFIQALDDCDPDRGLVAEILYEQIHESETLLGVVPCFGHVRGRHAFELMPVPAEAAQAAAEQDELEQEQDELEQEQDELEQEQDEVEQDELEQEQDEVEQEQDEVEQDELEQEQDEVEQDSESGADAVLEPDEAPAVELPVEAVAEQPAVATPATPLAPAAAAVAQFSSAPAPRAAREPIAEAGTFSYATSVDLPDSRSFRRVDPDLPKVIVEMPQPVVPEPEPAPESPKPLPVAAHIEAGDTLAKAGDSEGALGEFRKALGLLAPADALDRAGIFVRIAGVKRKQDKRREAISNLDKALQFLPNYRPALEELIELNMAEHDLRAAAAAEENLLTTLTEPDERFTRLIAFGTRWEAAGDAARTRLLFTRAHELRPDDIDVLIKLRPIYEAAGETDRVISTLRRIAELTQHPRARALRYFELAERCLKENNPDEDLALELFNLALDSDPMMLKPLEVVSRLLSERQEWSQLESAYERMIERVASAPEAQMKREVTYELYRQLGLLRRDHLEDFALSLQAFESALAIREDAATHVFAAQLTRHASDFERTIVHLQAVARLDPARASTYHELFEHFQKQRRPDQAYTAACVTVFLGGAEERERFIFGEHHANRVPKLLHSLDSSAWDLLTPSDVDPHLRAILQAIAPFAVHARLSQLAAQGRLTKLDPHDRHDVQTSTVSIARSFGWASHFLGVPPPFVHVRDDAELGLLAVPAEEPTVVAGGAVLRGRSLRDLAFLSGRHLAYHVGSHRLLLFYPSLEDLSACLLAAIRIVFPTVPVPPKMQESAYALAALMKPKVTAEVTAELEHAVTALHASGRPADLSRWAAGVERCATRAGYLLAGDLEVAATILRSEPRGLVPTEDKIGDLLGFTVSDAHHQLRSALGIAVQP